MAFLDSMAESSAQRLNAARTRTSAVEMAARAAATASPPPLRLHADGFDVIAELKLSSPSAGALAGDDTDLEARVANYARAGAAAVSVLTEPARFGGSLEHLERAARALEAFAVPVMRKDFLVDSYQVLEARAAGAGGVLAIARILDDGQLQALVEKALELDMFVLLEAFDRGEIARCARVVARYPDERERLPIGLNCRDLQTLRIDPARLAAAAAAFPADVVAVAESGLFEPADARRLAENGYSMALVGTALMQADDPAGLVRAMLAAGRLGAGSAK